MPDTEKFDAAGSSNIKTYAYSPSRSVLTIEFHSGSTWEYYKVPGHLFDEMKQAESKGKFLNSRIKGYFEGKQV